MGAWLGSEYPAVAARAKAEHAMVAWADQCGLRSDTAPPGRSWAPAGQMPTVKVSGRRFRVNIMSATASRGSLWFTVFTGKFTAKVFTLFLDRLARQAGRKVHVIADRHPVHRSKAVRTWLEKNTERIELHLMPGYSPDLNPDEILNADIKRNVHAARAARSTTLPARPGGSSIAASVNPAASRATSTPVTSAIPSNRQPDSFGSIIS